MSAGVSVQSAEVYVADTHYADFFANHPTLAQQIWQETAKGILETDFDPRTAYLEAFERKVATRVEDVAIYDDGDEEVVVLLPTQPADEVLEQLGATSLFMHAAREYYRTTNAID